MVRLRPFGAEHMVRSEVTEPQLRELFEQARSPFDGRQLGLPAARYPTRQELIHRRVGKLPDTLTTEIRAPLIEKIVAEEKETKTRTAVAGFDLTFSVPKSVSALWAPAPAPVQEQLYLAHRAAWLRPSSGLSPKWRSPGWAPTGCAGNSPRSRTR